MTSTHCARLLVAVISAAVFAGAASAAPETDVAVVEGVPRNAQSDPRGTTIPGTSPEAPSAEPTARGTTDRTSGADREAAGRTTRRRPQGKFPWAILLLFLVIGGAAAASN